MDSVRLRELASRPLLSARRRRASEGSAKEDEKEEASVGDTFADILQLLSRFLKVSAQTAAGRGRGGGMAERGGRGRVRFRVGKRRHRQASAPVDDHWRDPN